MYHSSCVCNLRLSHLLLKHAIAAQAGVQQKQGHNSTYLRSSDTYLLSITYLRSQIEISTYLDHHISEIPTC